MPPLDLEALKSSQAAAAKARLGLEKAQAKLDAARDARRHEAEALGRATALGDRAGMARATKAVDAAAAKIDALAKDVGARSKDLRPHRDFFLRQPLDAAGDIPLLLLPLRLETRFGKDANGKPLLRIRIYPDDVHLDGTDPGLTEAEAEAGRAYWAALFAAPDDSGIDAPWAGLLAAVGRARARLVARAMRPTNAAARGSGAQPAFPTPAAPVKGPARPRLLPDRFLVTATQGTAQLRAQGAAVDPGLAIGLIADDGAKMVDHDGLKVLEGTEWLADYDRALKAGMAIELPLPATARIARLLVYGVSASLDVDEGARALEQLLAAHDGGAGLGFLPQGTPTNNTEAGVSGWQRWDAPLPLPLAEPVRTTDANAVVTAAALGLGVSVLGGIAHADLPEQGAAGAMNAALWPATWGYFLETLDDARSELTPAIIEGIRGFHQTCLRGRGPLPALRIGDMPYGVLPFAGFGRATPAASGKIEAGIDALLRKLLPNWQGAVPTLPRLTEGGGAEKVLEIFGHAPVSWAVRARRCVSRDFLNQIQQTTTTGKNAADVEALLTQLLAESLGGFSYAYAAGSVDAEARPVLLPYADPARDADYARALATGAATGPISSVFQALITLGWARIAIVATAPPRLPEAIRVTEAISAALGQRIIGLSAQGGDPDPIEFGAVVKELNAVAPKTVPRRTMRPLAMPEDRASMAINATSAIERDAYGISAASAFLAGMAQRTDMRAGLMRLAEIGGDFSVLVAETLDTASHRLDAWITALSTARLARMRAAKPTGIGIGAFGWLEDIAPQKRGGPAGGYVAAPSLEQATTAGLLRSAYMAHNPNDGSGGAFAIDLSSARVRRAMLLLQGVAQGQVLGALLGYDFERRMHDADCDRFILSFRGLAPLIAGQMNAEATEVEAQAVAGVNVTDMVRLLEIWNDAGRGAPWVFAQLARRPEANEYLDPAVTWTGPDAAQQGAITAAMARAADDADALADLLMAESVHQLAQGNMARASAALDASGRGEAPPPHDPDVIQTRGPGALVTHRLIAVGPAQSLWPEASVRAQSSPEAEAWAAARLGDPGRITLGQGRNLGDTGLSALDFAALSRHPAMLDRVVRARGGLADAAAALPDTAPGGGLTLAEAALIGAAVQEVLDAARPLGGLTIGLPGANGWVPRAGACEAALARLDGAAGVLQVRLAALSGLLGTSAVAREMLMDALLDLTDFGIVLPDLTEAQVADLARLALVEGIGRLDRAAAARKGAAIPETVSAVAEALFGQGFPVPVTHVFAPTDPAEPMGERGFAPVAPGTAERYIADFGSVRPGVASFSRLALLAAIGGDGPAFVMRQMAGPGDDPPDDWIGGALPADRRSPSGAVVSLLADAPDGLDLKAGIAGLLIDEWTETLPARAPIGTDGQPIARTTAGVAIHADAPGAEPPQILLLALSPDGARWTEDSLCALLGDLIDLAQVRLVTLETVPLVARVLPAIYTQSAALQGQPVMDWSKIAMEATLLARTAGVQNFTMQREV